MSYCPSIFRSGETAGPDEIRFRGVCALGSAIDRNFSVFWEMTNDAAKPWDMAGWVDRLETEVLNRLQADAEDCDVFPERMQELLEVLSRDFAIQKREGAPEFLRSLASHVKDPGALNPIPQLNALHGRGFELASGMIGDPEWSSKTAAGIWGPSRKQTLRCVEEEGDGTFVPETTKDAILFKVRKRFQLRNALLEYLILEFEFMHEYVSHVLPVWKSAGGRLEEELLLVVANRYYWSLDPRGRRPELVDLSDERSPDYHRAQRQRLKVVGIAILPARLSQILVGLAVAEEKDLTKPEKDEFLARFVSQMPPFSPEYRRKLQEAGTIELAHWLNASRLGA